MDTTLKAIYTLHVLAGCFHMKVIISEAFFPTKVLLITYYWLIRVFPKLYRYKVGDVAIKGLHGKEQTVLNIW